MHGHSWHIVVEVAFGRQELDAYGWGCDFHTIKRTIDQFDHQTLNDHPLMGGLPPSAENLAEVIFWEVIDATGKMPDSVTVSEGKGNSVQFTATEAHEMQDPRGKRSEEFG